jgi:hypothetical protein
VSRCSVRVNPRRVSGNNARGRASKRSKPVMRVRCNRLHCGLPNRRIRIVPGHSHNAPLVQWLERELAKFETPVRSRQGAPNGEGDSPRSKSAAHVERDRPGMPPDLDTMTCSSGSASGCNPVPVRIVTAARLHGSAQGVSAAPSKRMLCGSTPHRTTMSGSSSWPRNHGSHP